MQDISKAESWDSDSWRAIVMWRHRRAQRASLVETQEPGSSILLEGREEEEAAAALRAWRRGAEKLQIAHTTALDFLSAGMAFMNLVFWSLRN